MSIQQFHNIVSQLPENMVQNVHTYADPVTTYYEDRIKEFKERVVFVVGPPDPSKRTKLYMCGEVFVDDIKLTREIATQLPEWIAMLKKTLVPSEVEPWLDEGKQHILHAEFTRYMIESTFWMSPPQGAALKEMLTPFMVPVLILLCAGYDYVVTPTCQTNVCDVLFGGRITVPTQEMMLNTARAAMDYGRLSKLIRHIPITDLDLSKTYHAVYVRHIRRCRTHRPLCGSNGTMCYQCRLCRKPTADHVFWCDIGEPSFLGIHVCEHCSKIKTTQFLVEEPDDDDDEPFFDPTVEEEIFECIAYSPSFVQKIIHTMSSPPTPPKGGV
jgi:hypothetical protein